MKSEWKHEVPEGKILYKYRTFSNFENLVDILIHSRLYAASYNDMNDPMEGCYNFPDTYNAEEIEDLEDYIAKQKFCSLSLNPNIDLMWAHYANGNRGICIGIAVKNTKKGGATYRVKYDGQPNLIHECDPNKKGRVRRILRHKSACWSYENEARIFSDDGHLVDVEIKEIIFGKRADTQLKPLVEALAAKFQPRAIIKSQLDLPPHINEREA